MMSAEERALRNGGHFPPSGLVDAQTGEPVLAVPCSNMRKHGPHIWRFASDPAEARVCPGVTEEHNV